MSRAETPQWAKERACAALNAEFVESEGTPLQWRIAAHSGHPTIQAFARYIAAHETPPVDPMILEARELCAQSSEACGQGNQAAEHRAGKWDGGTSQRLALASLRRGMELASEPKP